MSDSTPYPENVPGDFYVAKDCCTMCDMPFVVAKDLFGKAGEDHCYVKKQPTTADELRRMIDAAESADLGCIRYKGNDPKILQRLKDGPPTFYRRIMNRVRSAFR